MKKLVSSTGVLYVQSEKTEPFVTWGMALLSAQSLQLACATQGLMTNLSTSPLGHIEVRVHLDSLRKPKLSDAYLSTWHEITSQPFYNVYSKENGRCRVITYHFEHN